MRYTIEGLRADVMGRLGEIVRPQDQTSATDIPWPEDIIGLKASSLLGETGARLIREAPLELLGSGVVEVCGEVAKRVMPCGMYAAEVRLPEGFLRLVSVKMAEWQGSVSSLITPLMADWRRQWSDHLGIAGCPECPRAYLDSDGDGLLLRLVGSLSAGDTLEWMGVWTMPAPDLYGGFDFPSPLYPSLVESIAASIS